MGVVATVKTDNALRIDGFDIASFLSQHCPGPVDDEDTDQITADATWGNVAGLWGTLLELPNKRRFKRMVFILSFGLRSRYFDRVTIDRYKNIRDDHDAASIIFISDVEDLDDFEDDPRGSFRVKSI
ncbi:hypothetical protein BBP40_006096 [Aspergillus hancockii]|nr:hypothetical protein BBP40_006096 [Aspergillus hancockii]